jgi:hypothetical protein
MNTESEDGMMVSDENEHRLSVRPGSCLRYARLHGRGVQSTPQHVLRRHRDRWDHRVLLRHLHDARRRLHRRGIGLHLHGHQHERWRTRCPGCRSPSAGADRLLEPARGLIVRRRRRHQSPAHQQRGPMHGICMGPSFIRALARSPGARRARSCALAPRRAARRRGCL